MLKLQSANPCSSIFTKAAQDLSHQMLEESACLQSTFTLQPNGPTTYGLTLTESVLAVHTIKHGQSHYLYQAALEFDLKMEVIYAHDGRSGKMLNAKEVGFRLTKGSDYVQFYCTCPALASIWVKRLSQHLNQQGFHKLYKPLRKLGSGASATVYEVVRLTDNEHFAAKAFTKNSTLNSEDTRKRLGLLNEIGMLRSFEGENIVHCEGVFESEHSIYIILELLKDNFMKKYNERKGLFSEGEVKRFMLGMALGLDEMHGSRVMHRDIKPENILVRGDMTPVITDFGMAADADEEYIFSKCGTPGYVAPEVLAMSKGDHLEPECDIFSLGAVFHVLLTGRPLFDGQNCEEVYRRNKALAFDLSQPEYQEIEGEVMSLLEGMLERNPAKRIKAKEMVKHPYLSEVMECEKEVISPVTATSLRSVGF